MFENKTLIAVGDSYVYGNLGNDLGIESCHARSWVSRLARIGNFKSWVNLGEPGGSNSRAFRIICDYLDKNYNENEEYLIIFAVSQLARFELPIKSQLGSKYGIVTPIYNTTHVNTKLETKTHNFAGIGPWKVDTLINSEDPACQKMGDFLKMYYGLFVHDFHEEMKLKHQLFCLKYMFDSLNIEYYFTETICRLGLLKRMKFLNQTLPTIDYKVGDQTCTLSSFFEQHKQKTYPCGHFNDEANELLANYIYQCLKTKI